MGLLLGIRRSRELPGGRGGGRKDPAMVIPSPGPWSVHECSVTDWKKKKKRVLRAQPAARAEPFLGSALLQPFPCSPRRAAPQRGRAGFRQPGSLCTHQAPWRVQDPACPVLPCHCQQQHFELPAAFLLRVPSPSGWAGGRNLEPVIQF